MNVCKACSKNTVERCHLTGSLICTDCGNVNEEDFFSDASANQLGSYVPAGYHQSFDKSVPLSITRHNTCRVPRGKKDALDMIDRLLSDFNYSSGIGKESKSMFSNLYPKYKSRGNEFKNILSACCAYTALINHNMLVAVPDLCRRAGCTPTQFFKVYKKTKHELNMKLVPLPLEDEIRSILKYSSIAKLEDSKMHECLIKKTLKLVDIAQKCWLVTGRSQRSVIVACAFFAWKSLDINRGSCTFKTFAETFHLEQEGRTTASRVREFSEVLIKLANALPFISKRSHVNKKNVSLYIDGIINFFPQAKEKYISSLKENEDATDTNRKEFEEFRKRRNPMQCDPYESDDSDVQCMTDLLTDEQLLPDSCLHKYIRSPEEVEYITKLMGSDESEPDEPDSPTDSTSVAHTEQDIAADKSTGLQDLSKNTANTGHESLYELLEVNVDIPDDLTCDFNDDVQNDTGIDSNSDANNSDHDVNATEK